MLPIVLNAAHCWLLASMASWPYTSTWHIHITVTITPVTIAALTIVLDAICIDPVPPMTLNTSGLILWAQLASRPGFST